MARYSAGRNSFLYGEVSPRVYARNDIDQYKQMAELIENFVVNPQGGAKRRQGSVYRANVGTLGFTGGRMIPFEASDGTKHLIVIDQDIIRAIACANHAISTPASWESGVTYGTNFAYSYPASSGADLDAIQYSQFGDLLVLTVGTNEPLIITRELNGSFKYFRFTRGALSSDGVGGRVFTSLELHQNMPWYLENLSATTITPSGTLSLGGACTLTASSAIFSSDMAEATAGSGAARKIIGSYFRIRQSTSVAVVKITGYTSTTVVTGIVMVAGSLGTGATTTWSESAWSRRSGFPRSCTFYQERLWFGGGNTFNVDTFWASQIGDLYQMSDADPTHGGVQGDDDAFEQILNFGTIGQINIMSPGNELMFGTSTREAIATELDQKYSLGILNTKIVPHTQDGGSSCSPVRHNNTLVFADKTSQKLKEFIFSFQDQAYKTSNLSFFAGHLTKDSSIKQLAYQASEDIIWAKIYNSRTFQKSLVGLTRNKEFDILAWHRHYLGGTAPFNAATVDYYDQPLVHSVCAIPGSDGRDVLYVMVERDTDSNGLNGHIYIESIHGYDVSSEDTMDSVSFQWMDLQNLSSATVGVFSTPNTTWTNLAPHLASKTVSAVVNGNYLGEFTLSGSGTLTIPGNYDDLSAFVGYNYTSKIIPLALESNSLFGNGLGKVKRTEEITIVFEATIGAKFGTKSRQNNLQEIQFRDSSVVGTDPTPIFTGEKTIKLSAQYERNQQIIVEQTKPYPCTVAAIIADGVLYD